MDISWPERSSKISGIKSLTRTSIMSNLVILDLRNNRERIVNYSTSLSSKLSWSTFTTMMKIWNLKEQNIRFKIAIKSNRIWIIRSRGGKEQCSNTMSFWNIISRRLSLSWKSSFKESMKLCRRMIFCFCKMFPMNSSTPSKMREAWMWSLGSRVIAPSSSNSHSTKYTTKKRFYKTKTTGEHPIDSF